jgi:signal transduction histidine kinase
VNDVAVMIKRHAHDVRNTLNGMELELTLLGEATTDPAMREAVDRLRQAGAEISRLLRGLSSKYANESHCVVPAVQVAEQWSADSRHVAPGVQLKWKVNFLDENILVDPGLIRSLLGDLVDTAIKINGRSPLQISCYSDGDRALFEIAADVFQINRSMVDGQRSYWAALRAVAQRASIVIQPDALDHDVVFPIRLTLPLHSPEN